MDSAISDIFVSEIKSYYKSKLLDLAVVPSLNFRHFRFRLPDGSFYKVKRKIRTSKALQECLVTKAPLDVYYSTACWLNPHLLGSRVEKDILRNVIISCDLVFDIDIGEKTRTLDEARKQAIELNEFLESLDIRVRYSAFSGSKGFHVVCEDPWRREISESDPAKRETQAINRRKELVEKAKTRGLVFDEKVTVDPRRIIRLPGTINSKTGFLCTVVGRDELRSSTGKLFKRLRRYAVNAPRIQEGDDGALRASKIPGMLGRLGVRPKPEPEICYSTFITNNIPKTRLKVPILEFDCLRKMEEIVAVARRVQSKYGVGDAYIMSDGDKVTVLSLKAVSRRRVEKILFTAGSLNLNQSRKYGCTYTRVGRSVDLEGTVVQREPRLIATIKSELRGQASRPHFEFLTSMGLRTDKDEVLFCGAGKENLELVHAIIE